MGCIDMNQVWMTSATNEHKQPSGDGIVDRVISFLLMIVLERLARIRHRSWLFIDI